MRRRAASPRRQAHSGAWEKAATTRAAGAEQQVAGSSVSSSFRTSTRTSTSTTSSTSSTFRTSTRTTSTSTSSATGSRVSTDQSRTCDSLAPGVLGVRGALQGHGSTRSAESLRRCCSSPTTPGSPRNVPSYWEIIVESAAAQTPSPPRPNGERLRTSHDSSASAAIQSSSDPSCGRITQYTWRARVRRVDKHNTWSEPDGPGQEYPRRASATGRCRR